MSEEGIDRRKSPRIPVAARVSYRDTGETQICFTENLSEGGLFIRCEKPPFVGALMNLEISVPGYSELISLKGEVVWRHEGRGCGVRFQRVTAKIKKALLSFLDNQESDSSGNP